MHLLPEYARPYRKWFLWCFGLSLVFHCIGAWFSMGYFHPDEHFQILEFAHAKAGLSSPDLLAWEYKARLRPTFQPWIAYVFIKVFHAFGNTDPFAIATTLRFVSAIFGWLVSFIFCLGCFRWIQKDTGRKALIFLSAFLWFAVYVHFRFSSENWASNFFFLGLGLLFLKLTDSSTSERKEAFLSWKYMALIGVLFGFSAVCRLHNILLLPGVFLWLWLIAKLPFRKVFIVGIFTLLPLLFNIVLDRVYYGEWAISYWNYYHANINEGVAARYGVEPWWWYFPELIYFGKIAGALFWVCFAFVLIRRPRNPVIWALVPFVLVHAMTSHKELRFMFPILQAAPFLFAFTWEYVIGLSSHRAYRFTLYAFGVLFVVQNVQFLFSKSTEPIKTIFPGLQFIYRNYPMDQPTTILTDKLDLQQYLCGLRMNFYMPGTIDVRYAPSVYSVKTYIRDTSRRYFFIYTEKGFDTPLKYKILDPYCKPVYYARPEWLKKVNINNWADRTSTMRICECERR